MDTLRAHAEILNYPERRDGYYFGVQIAVDNQVSIPFDVPAAHRELYCTEDAWIEYLIRQARALIDLYGDARSPRSFSQFMN